MNSVLARIAGGVVSVGLMSGGVCAANLVSNGDFFGASLTDWNASGDVQTVCGTAQSDSCSVMFGSFDFSTIRSGLLSQNILTTAGNHYLVSFWATALSGPVFDLSASFGSTTIPVPLSSLPSYGQYKEYSADITVNSTVTAISVQSSGITGWALVDTVSVQDLGPVASVPEPATYMFMLAGMAVIGLARRRNI